MSTNSTSSNNSNISPKKQVLVIDDEEGIRESLKLILADEFPMILTNDGEQGLDCLANNHQNIGIVLLDIKMPNDNGLHVLEEIKTKYPDLKVIIITGYKSVETANEAVRLGAAGYIVKPFKSDEILATVRKNLTENAR
ncbi:MAG: response regulator [Candidatus Omnitrophica bacterium]|nr:response regulator [Candidatus Omnitrophota bacterium]